MNKDKTIHILDRKEALMLIRNNMFTEKTANEVDIKVSERRKLVDSIHINAQTSVALDQQIAKAKMNILSIQKTIDVIDELLAEEDKKLVS